MEGGWLETSGSQRIVRNWLEMQIIGPTPDLRNQKLWMGLDSLFSTSPPRDSDTHSYKIILKFP